MMSKLLFPLVGVALLAAGLVVGVLFGPSLPLPFGGPKAAAAVEAGVGSAERKAAPKRPGTPGLMYPLKERVVNLADPGIFRYLKVQVVLEIASDGHVTSEGGHGAKKAEPQLPLHVQSQLPKIEDVVNSTLSAKTTTELATPEGKNRLKVELVAKINDALHEEVVLAVYFTQFVMQ